MTRTLFCIPALVIALLICAPATAGDVDGFKTIHLDEKNLFPGVGQAELLYKSDYLERCTVNYVRMQIPERGASRRLTQREVLTIPRHCAVDEEDVLLT